MSTRVNSLPPPWPNQALAQAREASQIQPKTADPKLAADQAIEVKKAKAPAVDDSAANNNQSGPHDQKSAGEQAVTGHVNIEA